MPKPDALSELMLALTLEQRLQAKRRVAREFAARLAQQFVIPPGRELADRLHPTRSSSNQEAIGRWVWDLLIDEVCLSSTEATYQVIATLFSHHLEAQFGDLPCA